MTKILLADDEKIKRLKLARLLRSKGFSVSEARDGQEAVNAVQKERYDLLIIDNIMPKLTGIDACRFIKDRHLAPHLKTIIMIGYGSVSDYPEIKEIGISRALSKPLKTDELFTSISELFGN